LADDRKNISKLNKLSKIYCKALGLIPVTNNLVEVYQERSLMKNIN